jgi:hypothetical protein
MTYRGVYRDGVIVLSGEVQLHDGDSVQVTRESRTGKVRPGKRTSKSKKSKALHPVLKLAGIWKDREDWRGLSSVEVLELIRKQNKASKPAKKRKSTRA